MIDQEAEALNRGEFSRASVGEVLRSTTSYRVPFYQRDFAWTDEEIDAIWSDLTQSFEDDQGEYFLGAIVLSRVADEKVREVVDGQQRLVVLSMLFSIISREWQRRGDIQRHWRPVNDEAGRRKRLFWNQLEPDWACRDLNGG
jgi:hypothetical protein